MIATQTLLINSFLLVMLCQFGYFWKIFVTFTGLFLLYSMSMTILFSVKEPDRYIEIAKKVMSCTCAIFNVRYEDIQGQDSIDEEDDEEEDEDDDEQQKQIVISDCRQYYTYKGVHYDIAFPLFWVIFENPERGPHNCLNCSTYGSLRGVFIMYCANCAEQYNEEGSHVGYGVIGNGIELVKDDINKCAWRTYLKYRNPTYIGLPLEIEGAELEREGYEYVICEIFNENGVIVKLYPNFKEKQQDEDDDEDDDENDDEDDDENTQIIDYIL